MSGTAEWDDLGSVDLMADILRPRDHRRCSLLLVLFTLLKILLVLLAFLVLLVLLLYDYFLLFIFDIHKGFYGIL